MIVTCAPFRISFAGGGSDLPVFCRKRRGAVLSAAINRYVHILIHPYFNNYQVLLKYSKNEFVDDVDDIVHPIFREALKAHCPKGGVEIVSTADIPSGTGLGSSSTFTVALLLALHAYRGNFRSKGQLASEAAEIEIVKLGEPIGKQDQYAAAFGQLNFIEFNTDDTVDVSPLPVAGDLSRELESNLLLFYTGSQRNSREILSDQGEQLAAHEDKMESLQKMVEMAYAMREALGKADLRQFAELLHEGWLLKRTLSSRISNPSIDDAYARARAAGALGGKLLGAGGGGFLLFYVEPERQGAVRQAMAGMPELPFRFDWAGAHIVHFGEHYINEGFVS